MLVLMNVQATPDQVANVIKHVRERGFEPIELPGADRLAIGVLGSNPGSIRDAICDLPGVADAIPVSKPYKQVTREWHPEPTVVDVSGVRFGDGSFVVIAGPCAVESREQVLATARDVAGAGAAMFRGGAFKPRSSPYSFRGLGVDGLRHLAEAREATGLPVVTEVLTPADVELVSEFADMLQVVRARPGATPDDAYMDAFSFERVAPESAGGAAPRTKPIDLELSPVGELPLGLILNQDFANFARSQRGLHQPGFTHLMVSPTEECRIVSLHKNLEEWLGITPSEIGSLDPVTR